MSVFVLAELSPLDAHCAHTRVRLPPCVFAFSFPGAARIQTRVHPPLPMRTLRALSLGRAVLLRRPGFATQPEASPALPPYSQLGLSGSAAALTVTGPGRVTNVTPETLVDAAAAGLETAAALGAVCAGAAGDSLVAAARDGAALAKMRRETGAAWSCVDGIPLLVCGRLAVAGVASPCSPPRGHPLYPAADADVVCAARSAGLLVVGQGPWEPGAPGAAGTAAVPAGDVSAVRAAKEAAAAARGRAPWVAPVLGDGAPRAACLSPAGGVAAALVAGAAPVALTADAAGSARLAASWTGTVALLPTPGRLPRGGLESTVGARLDVPALASRSVLDAAFLLGLLQRPLPHLRPCPGAGAVAHLASDRPGDLMNAPPSRLVRLLLTGETGAAGWAANAANQHPSSLPLAGLRVALPDFDEDGADRLSPPARAALDAAAGALSDAGAAVFRVGGPRFFHPGAVGALYTLASSATSGSLRLDESEDDAHAPAEPLPGLVVDLDASGVVAHETGTDALSTSADPGRRLAREVAHAVSAARARAGAPAPSGCRDAVPAARRLRAAGARAARSLFMDGTAHVVLTPATPGVAPTVAEAGHASPRALAAMDGLVAPATLGGLPSVVVTGWECRQTGLPAGVALHAGPGRDAVALAAGVVVEAAAGGGG